MQKYEETKLALSNSKGRSFRTSLPTAYVQDATHLKKTDKQTAGQGLAELVRLFSYLCAQNKQIKPVNYPHHMIVYIKKATICVCARQLALSP